MNIQTAKLVVGLVLSAFLATGMMACGEMDDLENQGEQNQSQNDQSNDANNDQNNDANNDQNNDANNDQNNDANNDENNFENQDIEVAGVWDTNFGTEEVITDAQWGFRNMIDFDNTERMAITQNPESDDDDDQFAGTYSRIKWTEPENDVFFYCEDVFGAESEQEARDAESAADEDDLEEGCGESGFGWTEMTRQ